MLFIYYFPSDASRNTFNVSKKRENKENLMEIYHEGKVTRKCEQTTGQKPLCEDQRRKLQWWINNIKNPPRATKHQESTTLHTHTHTHTFLYTTNFWIMLYNLVLMMKNLKCIKEQFKLQSLKKTVSFYCVVPIRVCLNNLEQSLCAVVVVKAENVLWLFKSFTLVKKKKNWGWIFQFKWKLNTHFRDCMFA